jgi:hypothetical protein
VRKRFVDQPSQMKSRVAIELKRLTNLARDSAIWRTIGFQMQKRPRPVAYDAVSAYDFAAKSGGGPWRVNEFSNKRHKRTLHGS